VEPKHTFKKGGAKLTFEKGGTQDSFLIYNIKEQNIKTKVVFMFSEKNRFGSTFKKGGDQT
jgi:hypothetical protein